MNAYFYISFFDVSHLATSICLTFITMKQNWVQESILAPGMALTPFPSSLLDETRFEPTTNRSRVEFANH